MSEKSEVQRVEVQQIPNDPGESAEENNWQSVLSVILEDSVTPDYVGAITDAIRMIKGVARVEPSSADLEAFWEAIDTGRRSAKEFWESCMTKEERKAWAEVQSRAE